MHLHLVRHAQSENNAKPTTERINDPGITETGHRQALRLAQRLDSVPFTRLFTSPFRRALQTAHHIRRSTGRTLEIIINVHERGGCYDGWDEGTFVGRSGLNAEEIRSEFGEVKLHSPISPFGWWESKTRENDDQTGQRAAIVEEEMKSRMRQQTKPLVCVTHADFLSALLLVMLGKRVRDYSEFHNLKNAAVTTLSLKGDAWQLQELNSVTHLSKDLITE